MKKALYRKQICAEKEKLTPEKVFHTPQYRDLLTSIGHEITGGKLTTLRLYDDKNSGIAGWNQGETVAVNLGNQITSSFLTLELKSDSLIGILGHECGHYRYTDSALRKRYAEHMLNGSWYPKEPVPENAQEKEALDAMNVYFERKDKAILSIFLQTASYAEQLLDMMDEEENALQKIYLTGYVLELKKNRYFAGWYKDRIVCRSLEYARYFPSAEAAEEYVHKYLGFAGMTCYICHVNWTLASCGSENMEDNEENLLEENGKILSFANYADVKQYQKQRGMEHSTMAITYASRKKKIILAA